MKLVVRFFGRDYRSIKNKLLRLYVEELKKYYRCIRVSRFWFGEYGWLVASVYLDGKEIDEIIEKLYHEIKYIYELKLTLYGIPIEDRERVAYNLARRISSLKSTIEVFVEKDLERIYYKGE
jgi:hypothetical protein